MLAAVMKALFLLFAVAFLLAGGPARAQLVPSIMAGAEQGDAAAQYELGRAYEAGDGVPQDDFEAVRWLEAAARQDHPEAALEYGWMLANGYGVAKDAEQAYFWFARAAALGAEGADDQRDALARTLADEVRKRLYERATADLPVDTPPPAAAPPALASLSDPVLAADDSYEALRDRLNDGGTFEILAKLRLLAEDGDARAANLIGLALRRSIDARDRAAGIEWLFGAARAGLPAAQYNMARALLDDSAPGRGGKADYRAIGRWLDLAWAGSEPAPADDYAAVAREFAARAGLEDPYRGAVQGSVGAYPELRQLIRLARQDLAARREYDRRRGAGPADTGGIETTVIE